MSDALSLPPPDDYFQLGGVALALLAFSALLRWLTRPRTMPPLRATNRGLEMPRSAENAHSVVVPYRQIFGIELMVRGRHPVLLVATQSGPFVLPLSSFRDPRAPQRLRSELRRRLLNLPDGAKRLALMAAKSRETQSLGSRKNPLTHGLLAVLVGIFLFGLYRAEGGANPPLLRMGANAPALVEQGQWFRLLSANFLHGGAFHLMMNGMGLLALGTLLERLLGWPKLLLIYVFGGFCGAASSAWAARAALSVGASTAVFGLLGSLAYLSIRHSSKLPLGVRQPRQTWIFVAGINTALPLLIPQIDWMAHVGGGLGGALATALLVRGSTDFSKQSSPSIWLRAAAVSSGLLCVAALAQALPRTAADGETDWQAVLADSLTRQGAQPGMVNLEAWTRAISPEASAASLELAREALQRALLRNEDKANERNMLDTLATLNYRLGDFETAINLERRALASRHGGAMSWQIARFAFARLQAKQQSLLQGPASRPPVPELRWPVKQDPTTFELIFNTPPKNGAEVWLLATQGRQLKGALVVGVAPQTTPTSLNMTLPQNLWGYSGSNAEKATIALQLALVDSRVCHGPCPQRKDTVRWVTIDPVTAQYP